MGAPQTISLYITSGIWALRMSCQTSQGGEKVVALFTHLFYSNN
jgi:hypothetical protein